MSLIPSTLSSSEVKSEWKDKPFKRIGINRVGCWWTNMEKSFQRKRTLKELLQGLPSSSEICCCEQKCHGWSQSLWQLNNKGCLPFSYVGPRAEGSWFQLSFREIVMKYFIAEITEQILRFVAEALWQIGREKMTPSGGMHFHSTAIRLQRWAQFMLELQVATVIQQKQSEDACLSGKLGVVRDILICRIILVRNILICKQWITQWLKKMLILFFSLLLFFSPFLEKHFIWLHCFDLHCCPLLVKAWTYSNHAL